MMEIAQELHTSHATVLYWLKKYEIPRRSWSESAYAKQNRDGDPFAIPKALTTTQRELLAAALLLYWAEGDKTNKAGTKIGNLDGRMLQVFIRFLREVCCADESRLSVYVRVHRRFPLSKARRYWSRALELPPHRVKIYRHIDKRSKAHKQWSPYGLAILEFHSTKFKDWFDRTIEEYVRYLLKPSQRDKTPWVTMRQHGNLLAEGTFDMSCGILTDSAWDTQGSLSS